MDPPEIIPVIAEDVWRCERCGHETSSESLLAVHMAYNHKDFKLFKSVQSDHNKVKGVSAKAAPKVRCKKCPYTTTTVDDIKRHIKSVHKGVNKKKELVDLKCWHCDFIASNKVELTEHMNRHLANATVGQIQNKVNLDPPLTEGRGMSSKVNSDTGSILTPLDLTKESNPAISTMEINEEKRIGKFKKYTYIDTPKAGNSKFKSGESELINRYLSETEVVPLIEFDYSNRVSTPTLASLPNSEGMNVPTIENYESDSTLSATTMTSAAPEPEDGTSLSEVIQGEAESILSKVLGGNKQCKKYHAPSESSESSGYVTGRDSVLFISC